LVPVGAAHASSRFTVSRPAIVASRGQVVRGEADRDHDRRNEQDADEDREEEEERESLVILRRKQPPSAWQHDARASAGDAAHDVGLEADAALQRIAESASAADLDDEGWAIELGPQRLRPARATAEARPELLELRARPRPPLPAERIVQQDKVAANAGQNDGVLAEVDADRLALGRPPSRVRSFAETDPYHHEPSQPETTVQIGRLARARFTSLIP
jgi:hypothetical protein